MQNVIRIAVNGCGHGDLDAMYATVSSIEERMGEKVDLLVSCGDFQALRNVDDLHCFHCPPKYRAMKDFHRYYSGQPGCTYTPERPWRKRAAVGGNHEAVNHLYELYYGGWAAPNMYYLGHAGVVNFGGLRIAGLSGIYNHRHYTMGHFERPPYQGSSVRSAYHVRDLEVYRLLKVKEPVDVMVSHDWPTQVAKYGDLAGLLRCKPFFRAEIDRDELGSPPNWQLLQSMQPRFWCAGHLHVAFPAVVPLGPEGALQPGDRSATRCTRFIAVDKPLPKRRFIQVIEIPVKERGSLELAYDEEWLAILRSTHALMNTSTRPTRYPTPFADVPPAPESDRAFVRAALASRAGGAVIAPDTFVRTVEVGKRGQGVAPKDLPRNPQTLGLMELIGKEWNLIGEGAHEGRGNLRADDLSLNDSVSPDGQDTTHDDASMFESVEIHNYDPHAISDAREAQRKVQRTDNGACAVAYAEPGRNPEEISLDGL